MIYLIDASQFKIVFDKSKFGKALAISESIQDKLRDEQTQVLMGQLPKEEVYVEGHPFRLSDKRVNGKKAYEPILDQTETIHLPDLEWKIIKDEDQEGETKFIEIV